MNNTQLSTNIAEFKNIISQSPSSTILAINFPPYLSESDIFNLFSYYGQVQRVQKLLNLKNSCLIEFSALSTAVGLVEMSHGNKFTLGAFEIHLEYSFMKISSQGAPGNVIMITVSNVKYPITVDIIKQICQKYGKILRIHIGKKTINNIVESLVEFSENSEAKSARDALNGEDIYSGCCSLDIKMSLISSISVLKNDNQSWDFTLKEKPGILEPPQQKQVFASPSVLDLNYSVPPPIWPFSSVPPPVYPIINTVKPPQPYFSPPSTFSRNFPPTSSRVKLDINPDAFVLELGVVFTCYNIPFNMSVDHLFNLFCLFGNVNKIRFLAKKPPPATAIVQMGNRKSAELCIKHFNGRNLFNKELKLSPCIKTEVFVPNFINYLDNQTPAFKDFSKDPNNRFLNDLAISSNKVYEPSRTLHFFNAPSTFRENDLGEMLLQSGVPKPLNIIIFGGKNSVGGDKVKKCIGLFEFHRLDDALVALSVLNHKPIIIPETNQVYHLKLTFSAREPNKVGSVANLDSKKSPLRHDNNNEDNDDEGEYLYCSKKLKLDDERDTTIDNINNLEEKHRNLESNGEIEAEIIENTDKKLESLKESENNNLILFINNKIENNYEINIKQEIDNNNIDSNLIKKNENVFTTTEKNEDDKSLDKSDLKIIKNEDDKSLDKSDLKIIKNVDNSEKIFENNDNRLSENNNLISIENIDVDLNSINSVNLNEIEEIDKEESIKIDFSIDKSQSELLLSVELNKTANDNI